MENRIGLVQVMAIALSLGCSGVKFQSAPAASCSAVNQAFGAAACQVNPDGSRDFNYSVKTGEVDMLFVDDDSGSMYTEQEKMANQFPGFLDSLADFSYQIAIVSTDIDHLGPGNDGRFFEFAPGQTVLKNDSRSKDSTHYANIAKFQNTIKRQETLTCPDGPICPSGDERGIYALNRALERPENQSFLRPGGHLAIVILSDEDERSSGGGALGAEINGGAISNDYLAQSYDLPSTFVTHIKMHVPNNKSVSVHSIIVRPGDTACWNVQNSQAGGVKGFYGTQYALLSSPSAAFQAFANIVPGTLGSICSSNFTQEMGNIAANIRSEDIQLPCAPNKSTLHVDFLPTPSQTTTFDVDSQNHLIFRPAIAAGTNVHLTFNCPQP